MIFAIFARPQGTLSKAFNDVPPLGVASASPSPRSRPQGAPAGRLRPRPARGTCEPRSPWSKPRALDSTAQHGTKVAATTFGYTKVAGSMFDCTFDHGSCGSAGRRGPGPGLREVHASRATRSSLTDHCTDRSPDPRPLTTFRPQGQRPDHQQVAPKVPRRGLVPRGAGREAQAPAARGTCEPRAPWSMQSALDSTAQHGTKVAPITIGYTKVAGSVFDRTFMAPATRRPERPRPRPARCARESCNHGPLWWTIAQTGLRTSCS